MDSFDKKVSDIFNADSHDEVPAEFSWSEMNQDIYDVLDREESKKRPVLWFWFGGIASLIILAFIISNLTFENLNQPEAKNIESNNNTLLETPKSSINKTKENTTLNSKVEVVTVDQTITKTKETANNILIQSNPKLESLTEHKPYLNVNKPSSETTTVAANQSIELAEGDKASQSEVNNNSFFSNITDGATSKIAIKTIDRPKVEIYSLLLNRPQPLEYYRKLSNIEWINQEKKEKVDRFTPETKRVISPTIYTGTLLGFGLYDGADDRAKYSTWLPGYYLGFRAPLLSGEKYNLYTGYEHRFAVQKFEINTTREVLRPIKNALVHTTTNSLTGQQSHTHADTVGLSTVTHSYEYYNTFRSNSLNIGIQRSATLGPIEIGLSIGASYSFLVLSKGKTISNNFDIITYSTAQPIYRKSNWGIEGGMDINILLSKKLKFNLHARGEQSLNNWSIEDNISVLPSFVKLGGGLNYRF